MHKLLSTLLFIVLAPVLVFAQNKYPIVLVHGFSGWGRDELLGLKYWGGIQGDLQEQLKAQGYTVYTASVGPFSSNWDRAVELYAQIKGGRADYGAKHSTTHGHTRMGRTYPGLYPEWGNVVNGKVNKIHLIGHSMGGQTVRMLAQLLAKGSAGSPTGTEDPTSNSLFAGGKDWIHSITSISTPNQGTTLANGFAEIGDTVKGLLATVVSVLNLGGSATEMLYDAKLDQWGITPKAKTESLGNYINRVFKSPIFNPGFKDVCLWSLSTQGAAEESTWVQTLPNVYYFSYSTSDTFGARDFFLRKIHLPNLLTMILPLQPIGAFIGSRYAPNIGLSTDWQENDGVVPTLSMTKDSKGQLVTFNGNSQKGKWNFMRQLNKLDHLAVIGVTLHTQVKGIYSAHAAVLRSLPADGSAVASINSVTTESATTDSAAVLTATMLNAQVEAAFSALMAATDKLNSTEDLKALCANPINEYAASYCKEMIQSTSRRLRG
uniref:Lipase-like C-terminal domain-containing protein n=1 Tax=Globisporangium ultimum (strain ATCC 200006 / CBS 805.95 / DAOM BR144) TaxID=431595 RepID=K3WFI2_GLOUD